MAAERAGSASGAVTLATGLHVVPEFLGNRAPFADPHARAVIAGLGMERDIDSLVALYVAGLCGIGYGLRQIVDTQADAGVTVDNIVVSGGAGQHDFVRQLLADASGKPVVATKAGEPVLLGAAILAAVAGGQFADVAEAMTSLSSVEQTFAPAGGDIAGLHLKRYDGFKELQTLSRKLRDS
jgi:D-ribulokinase